MSIPNTKDGIQSAIVGVLSQYVLAVDRERVVDLVWGWRSEWLRDAEPRLRPVSETPKFGDVVAIRTNGGTWKTVRWDDLGLKSFLPDEAGWILLERAKPKTLAEEARELLERSLSEPGACGEWMYVARKILERVAEQRLDEPASPQSVTPEIKLMVDRFLQWPLPSNFSPDYGIGVDKSVCDLGKPNGPVGTNLLDAEQATEMVRFMVYGEPKCDE